MATTSTALPNLNTLFSESWALTKERWASVLGLWLVQGLITVLIFAAVFSAFLSGPLGTMLTSGTLESSLASAEELASLPGADSFFTSFIQSLLVVVPVLMLLGGVFQGASAALTASETKIGVGEALRIGFKKFLPVTFSGLLIGLLVLGGFFLLVIPGLVFVVLLSFTWYEIVIYNAPVLQALRTSAGMIKAHFWAVLGRMVVLGLLGIGVSALGEVLANSNQALLSLVNMLLNFGFSVFSVMYSVALYRNVRAVTPGASMSLTPLVVLSALGWLAGIILAGSLLQTT